MSDEIIKEVRETKDSISAKFNYDIRLLFEEIKRGEAQLKSKGINLVYPKSTSHISPPTALQRKRFASR